MLHDYVLSGRASADYVEGRQGRGDERVKVFTCVDHAYFWPVGVASIVVAPSEDVARNILTSALGARGLDEKKPFTLQEVDTKLPHAMILHDGNY